MARLSAIRRGAVGKPSLNRALVAGDRPETERATPAQGEVPLTGHGGPNPSVLQNRGMRWG